jgi:hypothetical protein
MVGLLVVIALIVLAETAVWRHGADSRDGNDWRVRCTPRRSPTIDARG